MKYILIGRGGLLTSIVLEEVSTKGYSPEFVIIETAENNQYPNLTELTCKKHNINYLLTNNPNSDECLQTIKLFDIDFILVASLGTILNKEILSCCTIYNVHMGVLPYYRGAFTNFWKIKNGDDVFGVTIHKMEEKVDSGKIMLIKEKDFSLIISGYQFFRLNYKLAAETVFEFFELIKLNQLDNVSRLTENNASEGKYYRKFKEDDFEIDLKNSCLLNYKFINRAQYYSSPFFFYENKKYIVRNANLLQTNSSEEHSQTFRLDFIENKTVILYNNSGILEMKL